MSAVQGGGLPQLFALLPNLHDAGNVKFSWSPTSTMLATCGKNNSVHVFYRSGELFHEFFLTNPQPVLSLQWDKDGETLAVMQHACVTVTLFSIRLKSVTQLDTGNKDLSFLAWSSAAPVLALGTAKGALVLYNHATQAKWTVQGKHAGAITTGAWSSDGRLALGSQDKTFSVSDANGNTIISAGLKAAPSGLQFSSQKGDAARGRGAGLRAEDSTVSLVLGGQTILLHSSTATTETPIELAFQAKYGEVKTFSWFGDGYVLVGFASGAVIALSSHMNEIRGEMQSLKVHSKRLNDLAFSPVLHKVASVGDDGLRVLDVSSAAQWQPLPQESCAFPPAFGEPTSVAWSPDGQILTVSTALGAVVSFLASVPLVGAASVPAQHLAYVSSLRRITVASVADPPLGTGALPPPLVSKLHLEVAVEPSLVALGPNQVAVAMNNRAWLYNVAPPAGAAAAEDATAAAASTQRAVLLEHDYPAVVARLELTATHAAALTDDARLFVHSLRALTRDPAAAGPGHELILADVTAFALLPTLLVYATADGAVSIFHLGEWVRLAEFRLPVSAAAAGGGGGATVVPPAITGLYPNAAGTKVVVVDAAGTARVLLANEDAWVDIPAFPPSADSLMWDCQADSASSVFAVVDVTAQRRVHTYVLEPLVVAGAAVGPAVTLVSSTDNFPPRYMPLLLRGGVLHGIIAGAPTRTQAICLHSHKACYPAFNGAALRTLLGLTEHASPHLCSLALAPAAVLPRVIDPADWVAAARELAALGRLKEAWVVIRGVEPSKATVRALSAAARSAPVPGASAGEAVGAAGAVPPSVAQDPHVRVLLAALRALDFETALSVAQLLRDTPRAAALARLQGVEDSELAAGFVQLMSGDLNAAQHLFLRSSRPEEAVLMRCDAQHWAHALKLAPACAPLLVADVSRRCAQQCEIRGDNDGALNHYRAALDEFDRRLATAQAAGLTDAEVAALRRGRLLALGGLARATARHGDVIAAARLAHQAGDRTLFRELAQLLEGMRLWTDAAEMHIAAQEPDRAVLAFINAKAFAKATPLIGQVSTPKVLLAYAKAMEATKNFSEAALAYERAHDSVALVRLLLSASAGLNDPQRAIALVRRTRNPDAAVAVADYCAAASDFGAAVEFLMLAKQPGRAFDLARRHNKVAEYGAALGRNGSLEDYAAVAAHFVAASDWRLAGLYSLRAEQWTAAVTMSLRAGAAGMSVAIDAVRAAHEREDPVYAKLAREIHESILAASAGSAADMRLVLQLYFAVGEHVQAARTAVAIAAEEQRQGSYPTAHTLLFDTQLQLARAGVRAPVELDRALLTLHSYLIVKRWVKRGDHATAAQLLARVARGISAFPLHTVPILTSTVIECQRAGYKRTSSEFAAQLARPEYRQQVIEKYRKKIELLARRPETEEEPQPTSPCPYCAFALPHCSLDCPSCSNTVPWCIVSGRHIVADDFCFCPSCGFPATQSLMAETLAEEGACPMCAAAVDPGAVQRLASHEVQDWLVAGAPLGKQAAAAGAAAAGADGDAVDSGAAPAVAAGGEPSPVWG